MSRIDTNSESWSEVAGWATSELARSRDLLESETTDHEHTLALRARIKLLKRLLELPSQTAPKDEPEVAFGITPPVS
jgi:hypothetical protein